MLFVVYSNISVTFNYLYRGGNIDHPYRMYCYFKSSLKDSASPKQVLKDTRLLCRRIFLSLSDGRSPITEI